MMRELEPSFELELEGQQITVATHEIGLNREFHID